MDIEVIIGIICLISGIAGLFICIKSIIRKEISAVYYLKKNAEIKYSKNPVFFIFLPIVYLIGSLGILFAGLKLLIA